MVYNGGSWGVSAVACPPSPLDSPLPGMHISSSPLVSLLFFATTAFAGSGINSLRPSGFVHTIDQNFAIDGKPFFFAGTNAYWFQFLDVSMAFLSPRLAPLEMTLFESISMT